MIRILLFSVGSTLIAQAATPGNNPTGGAIPDAGNEALLVWVIGLFTVAIALAVLEIFIPSGGIIGVVAALCAVGGVVVAFRIGTGYGMSALGFMAIATPTTFWIGLKVFPNTPVGRRIILSSGSTPEDLQKRESEKLAENQSITALVGAEGVAMTALRPGGTIRIDGVDVEAFAETGMIEAGQKVKVVSTSGRLLKVRGLQGDSAD